MPADSVAPRKRTPIVLVHGVGDQRAGDLLRRLPPNLAAHPEIEMQMGPTREIGLEDKSRLKPDDAERFFPVHVSEAELNGDAVVFAEVSWAGVSRLPPGLAGALKGLFGLIFGLKAVVSPNTRRVNQTWAELWVSRVGRWVSELLRGPLAVATAILLLSQLAGRAWLIALLIPLAVILAAWILVRAKRERSFEGRHPFSEYRSLAWSCIGGAVVLTGLLIFVGEPDADTPGGIWSEIPNGIGDVVLGFAWLAACGSALVYLGSAGFRGWLHPVTRSLGGKSMALSVQAGLWTVAIPLIWIFAASRGDETGELRIWFYGEVPSQGLQWIVLAVLAAALGITLMLRLLAIFRKRTPTRLLVGGLVQAALIAVTFYGVLANVALGLKAGQEAAHLGVRLIPEPMAELIMKLPIPNIWLSAIRAREWDVVPLVVVLLISTFLVSGVRNMLDIANDVINYLKFHFVSERARHSAWVQDVVEARRPIRNTFNGVLRFLQREYEFDRLIVIGHSQGTVIAVDELNESSFGGEPGWLEGVDVRLVTMGSPLAHVYQHYFPRVYPEWSDREHWKDLISRVDRWVDIYRIDDPIAAGMGMPEAEARDLGFTEKRLDIGGHLGYWRDARVAEEIWSAGILS